MTVYNRTIQIRLTKDEKEMIVNRMRDEGYHNLSAWFRKRFSTNTFWMEQKINEIHHYIMDQNREDEKGKKFAKSRLALAS